MASQQQLKKRLKVLMAKPENMVCSDCPERQPRWASLIVPPPGSPPGALPMGAFMCLECSGSHRRLGVHISFVRSVNLDSCKLCRVSVWGRLMLIFHVFFVLLIFYLIHMCCNAISHFIWINEQ